VPASRQYMPPEQAESIAKEYGWATAHNVRLLEARFQELDEDSCGSVSLGAIRRLLTNFNALDTELKAISESMGPKASWQLTDFISFVCEEKRQFQFRKAIWAVLPSWSSRFCRIYARTTNDSKHSLTRQEVLRLRPDGSCLLCEKVEVVNLDDWKTDVEFNALLGTSDVASKADDGSPTSITCDWRRHMQAKLEIDITSPDDSTFTDWAELGVSERRVRESFDICQDAFRKADEVLDSRAGLFLHIEKPSGDAMRRAATRDLANPRSLIQGLGVLWADPMHVIALRDSLIKESQ